MAEDRQTTNPPQTPEPSPERPRSRRASRDPQRRSQNSVFRYIAILFAAAFLLLLFTFIMERRQNSLLLQENEEQIDSLQQSVSAVQSLQGLYEENDRLNEQVAQLKEEIEELERLSREKDEALNALDTQLIRTKAAMDWFWQINEAYVRGRTNRCRELIASLEAAQLAPFLPRESITDNERFSPYDRYMEIAEAVS